MCCWNPPDTYCSIGILSNKDPGIFSPHSEVILVMCRVAEAIMGQPHPETRNYLNDLTHAAC